MPTKKPRINVVLEKPLFEAIKKIAQSEGVSVSLKARNMLRESIEVYEDSVLENHASDREKTFDRKAALSHDEVGHDQ